MSKNRKALTDKFEEQLNKSEKYIEYDPTLGHESRERFDKALSKAQKRIWFKTEQRKISKELHEQSKFERGDFS